MVLQRKTQGRQVQGGGVLYNPRGKIISDYYYNFRNDTNNKEEAYELLEGLQLAKERQIIILNVVGDSKKITRMMIQGSEPKYLNLKRIIDKIFVTTRTLNPNFLHVSREGVEGKKGLSPLV